MLEALADNEITVEIFLGIVLVWLVIFWWMRPNNRLLITTGALFALMIAFWFSNKLIVTDRRQIERNLHEMAVAVIHGQADQFAKHLSKDCIVEGQTRDHLKDAVPRQAKSYGVTAYNMWDMTFDKVAHAEGTANAAFALRIDKGSDTIFMARCKSHFVLEAGEWRLQTAQFFPIYGNSNEAIHVPLP